MRVTIDSDGVARLRVKLDRAVSEAPEEAGKVVEKGALNIKNGMRRRVGGIAHAPAYPAAITYDRSAGLRGPEAEIGPDKRRRQGALGNILNYGSVNNAPIPHVEPAADEELPRFEKAMEDLAVRLLEDL
ncbi:hypothetical protein ACFWC6_30725 [Micromonospora chalcea]